MPYGATSCLSQSTPIASDLKVFCWVLMHFKLCCVWLALPCCPVPFLCAYSWLHAWCLSQGFGISGIRMYCMGWSWNWKDQLSWTCTPGCVAHSHLWGCFSVQWSCLVWLALITRGWQFGALIVFLAVYITYCVYRTGGLGILFSNFLGIQRVCSAVLHPRTYMHTLFMVSLLRALQILSTHFVCLIHTFILRLHSWSSGFKMPSGASERHNTV